MSYSVFEKPLSNNDDDSIDDEDEGMAPKASEWEEKEAGEGDRGSRALENTNCTGTSPGKNSNLFCFLNIWEV